MVDALSLRLFGNLFSSVADEMGVTLKRASYSPNIKMRLDFSCALFDAQGRLLAQAAHIPVHLGAMPMAMEVVRERFDLRPGDIVIMNDPYAGGTHLPDISLISGAFTTDGHLLGYVMSRAHHSDVGGMSPGSMPLSREIYQEGITIPPVLLMEEGHLQQGVMDLILRNVRTPDERQGDFMAQIAAQRVGEGRLAALADAYGADTVAEHGEALQNYTERMMRASIARIPPGEYAFLDHLDGDGLGQTMIPVGVTIRRREGSTDLEVDFSASAGQVAGPLNAVRAVTFSATLYVLRCVQREEVPVNQGSMRPLHVIMPEGSVVAAQRPAPVAGGNVETSQRITDVLLGALARALPEAIPAASQGTMNNFTMGGWDPARGRHFAYYETMGGGMGGRPGMDGLSGVHDHMSNTLNTPVEVLESAYPVRVRTYRLRAGSGGAGANRGGDGLQRDIEFLVPAEVTVLSERRVTRPYGLEGGEPGEQGENVLQSGGDTVDLGGKRSIRVREGDVVSVRTPGGGGWGRLPR